MNRKDQQDHSIRARVLAGFASLLIVMATLGGLGYFALSSMDVAFSDFEESADATFDINELNKALGAARLGVEKYFADSNEDTAEDAILALDELIARSQNTEQAFEFDPSAATNSANLIALAEDAKAQLTAAIATRKTLNEKLAVLSGHSREIQRALVGVTDLAFSGQDYNGTYYSAMALQQFSQATANFENFLLTNSQGKLQLALTNAGLARSTFKGSIALNGGEQYESRRIVFFDELKAVQKLMREMGKLVAEKSSQADQMKDVLDGNLANTVRGLTEVVVGRQAAIRDNVVTYTDHRLRSLISLTAAALGAGLAFAWLTERSIGRSIDRFSLVMRRLADDDLDVDILGARAKHPLGQMAAALTVLREKAKEARSVEAQKKELLAQQARETLQAKERDAAEAERARQAKAREEAREAQADEELRRVEAAAEAERQTRRDEQASMVAALADGLQRLSAGDVRRTITEEFPEGQEKLREDYNEAIEALRSIIERISAASDALQSNASEIEGAAGSLAKRTENAAHTLAESASAIRNINTSVRATAESAGSARKRVSEAIQSAETANKVVERAMNTMTAISASSQKVSTVTDLIEDIAFQTNLLSLNASVEAARAGEAGLGFAVVAAEVRALSQRSSEAASEIDALIKSSGIEVKRGVDLVNETGTALGAIIEHVSAIAAATTEIATTAEEQAIGISEIDRSIGELDQSTQSNAAISEEVNAAGTQLSQEAAELTRIVASFILVEDENKILSVA